MAAVSLAYWSLTQGVFSPPPPPEWCRVIVGERPGAHLGMFFHWCEDDEREGEWAWTPGTTKPTDYMFAFSDYRTAMAFKLRWV